MKNVTIQKVKKKTSNAAHEITKTNSATQFKL